MGYSISAGFFFFFRSRGFLSRIPHLPLLLMQNKTTAVSGADMRGLHAGIHCEAWGPQTISL